jgi:hypothetical protein
MNTDEKAMPNILNSIEEEIEGWPLDFQIDFLKWLKSEIEDRITKLENE